MRGAFKVGEKPVLEASVTRALKPGGSLSTPFCSGKLILTNLRLIFEPDVFSFRTDHWQLALPDIKIVENREGALLKLPPNLPSLTITPADARSESFAGSVITFRPSAWAEAIEVARKEKAAAQPAEESAFYYYVASGHRIGPLTQAELEYNRQVGKIGPETLVWPGSGNWQQARSLAAGSVTSAVEGVKPPPAPLDDRFAWAIVAVPLIGVVLELLLGNALIYLYLIANSILCIVDAGLLKGSGRPAPHSWWEYLLVPVYLWKRSARLHQKQIFVVAWLAAFGLSLFVGQVGNKAGLEASACPIVTQIIQEQLYASAACKGVTIVKDVGGGFYTAAATLDNGNEIKITIQQRGKEIYVQIPRQ